MPVTSIVMGRTAPAIVLDKRSAVPAYLQIADSIRRMVRGGKLDAGAMLPPSEALCRELGISRMTLRQAYGVLEREGLIEAQRGRGTFVTKPRVERTLDRMIGFSEEMRAWGKTASTKLLAFEEIEPRGDAREFLGNGAVYSIERLRLADAVPMAIERVQIRSEFCPHLQRFNLAKESLYSVLETEYGIQLGHCDQVISASMPGRGERTLLGIGNRVALLNVTRKSFTAANEPLTFGVTCYRSDLYTAAVRGDRLESRFGRHA